MKVGLTLGKYAPLHRGHQHVIETALAEMDRVIVLIYDAPEVTPVPLPVRAAWIRKLYPQVEVLEAWDGPVEIGSDPALTARHDAYLKRRLAGRMITHFYSSEFYGEHVSRALGAVDRQVDSERLLQPISATMVRSDPYRYRQFLDPLVYRDLITQVVFLGAPSTGKTTLAAALAQEHRTVWVPEYGREYWEKHQSNRRLSLEQLFEIGVGHRQREEAQLMSANRYLFIDTDATTTRQFSLYYHDACDERLEQLASETRLRYDLFFLCLPDIPYDDTWDRSGAVFREVFQRRIEADLITRRIPYAKVGGSLEQRMASVNEVLSKRVI
jgi:NadR type nicotinamide-nucleotide adenylyltransferase